MSNFSRQVAKSSVKALFGLYAEVVSVVGAVSSRKSSLQTSIRASFQGLGALIPAALLLLGASQSASAALPWLSVQGNQLKDPNGNRVILRGISLIDIGTQQTWYGGLNPLVDRITNKNDTASSSPGWYPKVLRLPVVPDGHGSPLTWKRNDGDSYYNNVLRPLVNYCRSKDVYCIVDLHYIDNIDVDPNFVNDFWAYMAPRFANDSNVLFEIYNEPISTNKGSDTANWSYVKGYEQNWITTIRKSATRNLILAGTPNYSQILLPAVTNQLSGSNLMYVVHTYPQHWGNGNTYQVNQIKQAANTLPLFMTEWGYTQTSDALLNGSGSGYGTPLMNLLDQYGISWTAWVASTDWAPAMFYPGWTLRVGPNEMGGFVKDTLYAKRNSNQPQDAVSGQTLANGTYKIVCRNGGLALDNPGYKTATTSAPVLLDQWTYGGGNNQRWNVTNLGGGQYSIVNVYANQPLDVAGAGGSGSKVELYPATGANNQKWTITATSSGYYRLSPVHDSSVALDVYNNSTANGGAVDVYAWNSGNNQQWAFQTP